MPVKRGGKRSRRRLEAHHEFAVAVALALLAISFLSTLLGSWRGITLPAPSLSGNAGIGGTPPSCPSGICKEPDPGTLRSDIVAVPCDRVCSKIRADLAVTASADAIPQDQIEGERYEARPVRTITVSLENRGTELIRDIRLNVSGERSRPEAFSGLLAVPSFGLLESTPADVDDTPFMPELVAEPSIAVLLPGERIQQTLQVKLPMSAKNEISFDVISLVGGVEAGRLPIVVEKMPPVFATLASAYDDGTFDVYAVFAYGGVRDAPAQRRTPLGAVLGISGGDITIEMNVQAHASEGYRPSLSVAGAFDALFEGPRTAATELFGPYPPEKTGFLLAQRFLYRGKTTDDYLLQLTLNRGVNAVATDTHDIRLAGPDAVLEKNGYKRKKGTR